MKNSVLIYCIVSSLSLQAIDFSINNNRYDEEAPLLAHMPVCNTFDDTIDSPIPPLKALAAKKYAQHFKKLPSEKKAPQECRDLIELYYTPLNNQTVLGLLKKANYLRVNEKIKEYNTFIEQHVEELVTPPLSVLSPIETFYEKRIVKNNIDKLSESIKLIIHKDEENFFNAVKKRSENNGKKLAYVVGCWLCVLLTVPAGIVFTIIFHPWDKL